MRFPFVLAAVGFACSFVLTPTFRALAIRWGLVDKPDGRRKLHGQPIAVSGGVPILVSVIIGGAVGWFVWPMAIDPFGANRPMLLGLLAGAVTICAVGVADDCRLLRGWHKLVGQLLAIALVVLFGVAIERVRFFEWELELGLLSVPFTFFFLLGAINSLNLIDGMDGLLSTVALIVMVTFGAMAFMADRPAAAGVAFLLAGSILGFLRYNFPPASVFPGDAGSMLIGLIVGVLAIQSSLKGPATVALAAPMAVLVVPIFDSSVAILRRKLTGRSLCSTDRSHLHHCLLRRGWSNRKTLFVIACLCLLTVAGTLASIAFNSEILAILGATAVVSILLATRIFGNAELTLLLMRVRGFCRGVLRGPARPVARETQMHLHGSLQWKDLMSSVVAHSQVLNLVTIKLDVNAPAINESYHAYWHCGIAPAEEAVLWRAEIPLSLNGHCIGRLEIAGNRDEEPIWRKLSKVVPMVQTFEAELADRVGPATVMLPPVVPSASHCEMA